MNFQIISPETIQDLKKDIQRLQGQSFRFGAGYTDLLMELRKSPNPELTIVNLARVTDPDFTQIKWDENGFFLGAMVSAFQIHSHAEIEQHFPVLKMAAMQLASTQIRQVATVGGNLCTASPSGDLICALVALNAQLEIMNVHGELRSVSIHEFYLGVRKTVLNSDEFLYRIFIPFNFQEIQILHSTFIKIGTRKAMECSVVSLAYHIQLDNGGKVVHAGIGLGAVAPTVKYAESACHMLKNNHWVQWSPENKSTFVKLIMDCASPISDIRATAWYRTQVLHNLSLSILEHSFGLPH